MKPKPEIFVDAITLLREEIVEEAQDYRFRKKSAVWKKFGSLAACLVLLVSISLLVLPMRGCGGSAPPAMNSSGAPPMQSTDTCAPADEPASGEPAPEPAEDPSAAPENGYSQADTVQLTAMVVEIHEDYILVKHLESENENDLMEASIGSLELPELVAGDIVCITHVKGPIYTTNPPILPQIISIEKIHD